MIPKSLHKKTCNILQQHATTLYEKHRWCLVWFCVLPWQPWLVQSLQQILLQASFRHIFDARIVVILAWPGRLGWTQLEIRGQFRSSIRMSENVGKWRLPVQKEHSKHTWWHRSLSSNLTSVGTEVDHQRQYHANNGKMTGIKGMSGRHKLQRIDIIRSDALFIIDITDYDCIYIYIYICVIWRHM